jgi:hypothetical protein
MRKSTNSKAYEHNTDDSSCSQLLDQWPTETIEMFQKMPMLYIKNMVSPTHHKPKKSKPTK